MKLLSRLVMASVPIVPKALVGRVAKKYVGGDTHEEAIALTRELNALGAMVTLGPLGEAVTDRSEAQRASDEHLELIEAIHASGVDASISLKPTLLGLKLDADFCREAIERISAAAAEHGNFVRLDMEDHTCTDDTLDIYRELQPRFGNLGVVLQAYMRRTLDDIAALNAPDLNVRLCKGIYIEPRAVAWKGYETIRRNFLSALEKLLASGVYVGIATHDEYLVCEACALVERYGVDRSRYEFQTLLGVDEELRDVLIQGGHRVRVYVPYGRDWYKYSIRRLRENPEVAGHVIRATLGLG